MEKFIECLKQKAWALANKELDNAANSFGFARIVPETVEKLNAECSDEAETFFMAFVFEMSQSCPDGRNEKSVGLARKLVSLGLESVNPNANYEVGLRVKTGQMHKTVMQQAAQLAFYFLDSKGLIPEEVKDCDTWWRMPLI